ncbi:MAG: protein-tyrosine phosphatase family protein, partial [Planctomycetota bacterium]
MDGLAAEPKLCADLGLEFQQFPIADHGLPESAEAFLDLIERLHAEAQRDRAIVVHCFAGIGRSTLVAARGPEAVAGAHGGSPARAGLTAEPMRVARASVRLPLTRRGGGIYLHDDASEQTCLAPRQPPLLPEARSEPRAGLLPGPGRSDAA